MSDTAPAPAAPATATPSAPSPAPASSTPTSSAAPATATGASTPAAPKLAEIKASRRERSIAATKSLPQTSTAPRADAQPVNAEATPSAEAAPADAKPATASIDMDADALKNFTNLNRELREAKTKLKNTEERIAAFGRFEKAAALAKDGKHYDAAREAGIDVDAALAELLGKTDGNPSASQVDGALAKRLEAIEKKQEAQDKKDADAKEAEVKAQVEADRKTTQEFVAKNLTKYPFLAKSPKLVDIAFKDYAGAKEKVEAEEGRPMTADEQTRLLLVALSSHEEDWANALGDKKPSDTPAPGIGGDSRAGVKQPPAPVKAKLTFEELKAERAAKRRTA